MLKNVLKKEAFPFVLMCRKEGRPDWRLGGRYFPKIFRKSRANRCELGAPASRPLIESRNTPLSSLLQTDNRSNKM